MRFKANNALSFVAFVLTFYKILYEKIHFNMILRSGATMLIIMVHICTISLERELLYYFSKGKKNAINIFFNIEAGETEK